MASRFSHPISHRIAATALLAAMAVAVTPVPGHAVPEVDFGIVAPTTGTISYNGLGGPLVGSNIVSGSPDCP